MPRQGRILVVDDEVNARTALAELLRDEGFEVETAADAFKAPAPLLAPILARAALPQAARAAAALVSRAAGPG